MRYAHLTVVILFCLAVGGAAWAGDSASGGHDMSGADMQREEWSESDDAAFLHGMIEHHKGAVEMAIAALRAGKDEDVKRWAKAVIIAQEKEIGQMQKLVSELGVADVQGAGAMMKEHMRAMLANPVSPDADINFVAQMVPHHAAAVDMSLPALVESDKREIRVLARDIIAAQAGEIYEFREWLGKKGY